MFVVEISPAVDDVLRWRHNQFVRGHDLEMVHFYLALASWLELCHDGSRFEEGFPLSRSRALVKTDSSDSHGLLSVLDVDESSIGYYSRAIVESATSAGIGTAH